MSEAVLPQAKCGVPIAIRGVAKIFGEDSGNPFRALKEITVDIQAGEFVSVVGPSGCGKSTLMLMVAGLLARSRGDIAIGGQTVTRPVTDVGIAFQDHLLLDFRTALSNVTLHADSQCGTPLNALTLDAGTTQQQFFFSSAAPAMLTLTVDGGTLGAATQSEQVTP